MPVDSRIECGTREGVGARVSGYSERRASTGSTDAARRAGR